MQATRFVQIYYTGYRRVIDIDRYGKRYKSIAMYGHKPATETIRTANFCTGVQIATEEHSKLINIDETQSLIVVSSWG